MATVLMTSQKLWIFALGVRMDHGLSLLLLSYLLLLGSGKGESLAFSFVPTDDHTRF